MPDSGLIDNALVDKLNADATLLGYLPSGAYFDEAPPNKTRFAIVSLMDESDAHGFGGRVFEEAVYLVKAVVREMNPANSLDEVAARNAEARIDALLDGATLTAVGYSTMVVRRQSRFRTTEVDDVDPTIRWYHRGGQYEVVMST